MTLPNNQTQINIINNIDLTGAERGNLVLPFDVQKDLNQFSRIYVAKETDSFRIVHCCQYCDRDYKVFGELPNGDKTLLFNVIENFQCCDCWRRCNVGCEFCFFACCDQILIQMDYRRNDIPFYTQGFNITQGCHCCECIPFICPRCIPRLYLRENNDPDNTDIKTGVKRGATEGTCCCCILCNDAITSYRTQEKMKGNSIRAPGCTVFANLCVSYNCQKRCPFCCDMKVDINNGNGENIGYIMVPNGCNSYRLQNNDKCCQIALPHYEINFTQNISSEEKFQVIADVIHFDVTYLYI